MDPAEIGGLEKRLDVPHVHVMVEDHVALLHGEVPGATDRAALERAVLDTPGVRGIESYLHVGLLPGSTRPSKGRARAAEAPSVALRELLDAARGAEESEAAARSAVRAVLATFAARIPLDERDQMFAHLPADVRRPVQSRLRPTSSGIASRNTAEARATCSGLNMFERLDADVF